MNKNEIITQNLKRPRMLNIQGFCNANSTRGLYELIKDFIKPDMIGVEIGSYRGVSSELFALHCKVLFCVDPYMSNHEFEENDIQEAEYTFNKTMSKYPNVNKIKLPSVIAASMFAHQSVDFVYIDANHSYEMVKQDIISWSRVLKPGGILCGHDYMMADVNQAVHEFGEPKTYPDSSWVITV